MRSRRGEAAWRGWVAWAVPILLASSFASCGGDEGRGADQPGEYVVAILRAVRSAEGAVNQAAFLDELRISGLEEGRNLRLLGADLEEVYVEPAAAQEAVRRWSEAGKLDLIVALSSTGALAASRAAPDTNVLFLSNDPLSTGLVTDERRPDGRLTGATFRVPADRTLDLTRRALARPGRIGFLYPSSDPAARPVLEGATEAAAGLGIDLAIRSFADSAGIAEAVRLLGEDGATCLVAANSPATARSFPALRVAADEAGLPVIANTAADFAVVVLEPDVRELYRQMARQAARLLSGVPVADVPVEDPGRFSLVLNLGAAERAGITFPPDLVASADRLIRP